MRTLLEGLGLTALFISFAFLMCGCGGEDCSGDGANCHLIATGEEPPCCEGLTCQDSPLLPDGPQVCR
jgi:hypothetical protein